MNVSLIHRLRLLPLLALLSLLLSSCDTGLAELVAEMALDWAQSKNLISFDAEGNPSVNMGQIIAYEAVRAGQAAFGSGDYTTGDTALDAALDAGDVVKSVKDADELANRGMAQGDPALLDSAIQARPSDWNYHDQKGAILVANGDAVGAEAAFSESEALVERRIDGGGSCRALMQNMLRGRIDAYHNQLVREPDNEQLMNQLFAAEDELEAVNQRLPGNRCEGRQ